MSFVWTEEQESLAKAAREFAQTRMPVSHLRALRDGRDAVGFSRERWSEMAVLGWPGITIAEEHGGSGLGFTELGLVLRALGRTLAPHPFLSTAVLSATALTLGTTDAQRARWLPAIASGGSVVAFAHDEGTRHARTRIATRALESASGLRLVGDKTLVLDGHVAEAFIVVARTSGAVDDREGLTLCRVPRDAPGVTITRTSMVDSRNAANVRFESVEVQRDHVLGTIGRGADSLDVTLDRATIALSAEMLGGAEELFERTLAYLKTRRQFGVPIGSFQALKHRAAQMFCELELSKSIVQAALSAIDEGRPDVAELASAAKARVSDTFVLVANEAVQMHGGVGVTDELDIGLFLKRARVTQRLFGDAAHHRDRFARLRGY
ncbi:MAG: acyl-CoA dehydrogenase family protein [Polyangiales bacterium]